MLYEHRKFFAVWVDLTIVVLSKLGEGGGMFLFSYRTDLLKYFVGKKQIEKTRGGFFGFVR